MITNPTSNSTSKTLNGQPPAIFLSSGIPPHKDKINHVECSGNEETGTGDLDSMTQHLLDIETLNSTELRKKYPRTYKCWDNMKQRRSKGAIINLAFESFKDFLRHVGPCEKANYTLDRINNDDPEYAPGKVQWRDKYAQNSNKGNNIFLAHENGEKHTIAQWAKLTQQKASTLYKRHENGWSDMEIISGKRVEQKPEPGIINPWPYGKEDAWERQYKKIVIEFLYNKPRINFLYDFSEIEFFDTKKKINVIELAIHNKNGFEDYSNEVAFRIYLDDYGYNRAVSEYNDTDIEELAKQLESAKKKLAYWSNIHQQAGNIVQYEMKKDHYMSKNSILPKKEVLDYFHAMNPKPKYTLNLPPENG